MRAILSLIVLAATAALAQTTEARVDLLEARINNVESIRAIKRLQYAYGHYVEFGLWDDFADLFTEDAATNYVQGAQGRAGVRKLFFEQVGQGKLGLADGRIYPHILFQPVITLGPDGRTAKGRWRILAMLGGMGGSATWYSGVYENEYVLRGGVWKISKLRSEPMATAAYTATGWKDSGVKLPAHYGEAPAVPVVTAAKGSGAIADRVRELARRAALLKDQADVTNVQDTYGYAFDRKRWDEVANLFAADGTMELGQQGVYMGKVSIRRGLNQFGTQGLSDHVYLQTLVTVAPDGRTAKARGVELIQTPGEMSEGVFENTFVKQGEAWKIQSVHFYPRMIVDAATGWAKSAKPAPGPSAAYPPDRPPSSVYEIYPKFSIAPFHFDNPVTGKAPQYPAGVSFARAAVPNAPSARNANLADAERSAAAAEAYDAAEHVLNAHGYSVDRSPMAGGDVIFVDQVLQPVIEGAADGKSAKVRARTLDLTGTSGAAGFWRAGTIEGDAVFAGGAWKLDKLRTTSTWTAPYPGGWK